MSRHNDKGLWEIPGMLGATVGLAVMVHGSVNGRDGSVRPNHTVHLSGLYTSSSAAFREPYQIIVRSASATTDAAGHYAITGLCPEVEFKPYLRSPEGGAVEIEPAQMPPLRSGAKHQLDLTPKAGNVVLEGNIIGSIHRTPIETSATVLAFDSRTRERVAMRFIKRGASYRLNLPRAGTYRVGAQYQFFLDEEEELAFNAGKGIKCSLTVKDF